MTTTEQIALVDRLRALQAETEWFEELRRAGRIANLGSRFQPAWCIGSPSDG